jgi:hypothetical protein
VYLGSRYGTDWSERHFSWDAGKDLPESGSEIEATDDVNLRSDHIRFNLEHGWQNAEIIGLVRRGDTALVLEVKEVASGFIWARIETRS